MKRVGLLLLVASMGLCVFGIPALAHHSFAAVFDADQPITVKGIITKIRLENPHSWFFLDVKGADGKIENWAFEAGTPSGMIRNGFTPQTIKAGLEVTIKGIRARDKSQNMGMLRELITADGKSYGAFGSQNGQ